MTAITYQDFSGGLDHRLSINVQEANKLWTLKNAYVTQGKRMAKRPGLKLVSSELLGSFGLQGINGRLKVFADSGSAFTAPVVPGLGVDRVVLDKPSASGLDRIYYADIFQNDLFVVARYADGTTRHHYLDQTEAVVTITIASPGVVTWTDHGRIPGDSMAFATSGTLPTGIVSGIVGDVITGPLFYVFAVLSANTFTISATPGGPVVNTTGAQAGTHAVFLPSYISDVNCPNTVGTTKAASRVFAPSPDGQTVRYCKAGNVRDWTTSSDAGFLPVALQQDTKSQCVACGTFQDALVVLFPDSSQIWTVNVDPSTNSLTKRLYGVGTSEPLSIASFFSDLIFLSPFGFRSMMVQSQTNRIDDYDTGVPVDPLVNTDLQFVASLTDPELAMGLWIREFGQYWAVLDMGTFSKVWVYTVSKISKISCWSEYIFPIKIKAITALSGKVYLRTDDSLFEVSPSQYTDANTLINVEIQMAFQDAKSPGVLKQVYGADYVFRGSANVSFKYDPRDLGKETIPQLISSDTRAGDLVPVEVCSPSIAPVFRHAADEAFEVDAVTFYFNLLGTQ